jgi:hypothetical protein
VSAVRAIVLVALASIGGTLSAAPVTYFGILSGPAENPPNASTATGFALVTIDDAAYTMSVSATFSGLTSGNTAAHIHCCTADPLMNVGIATPVPTFPDFPSGATSGTYAKTFDMTLASSYRAQFITANGGTIAGAEAALFTGIANGWAYFNIHTTNYPGGEIRSFLYPDKVFGNGMELP